MLYLGGIQLVYWVKMNSAKHEAASFIQNRNFAASDTRYFVFTTAQYKALQWLEENKEFNFNGQHYDITDLQYMSDGVKITCYSDNEETEIANAFQKFADKFFPAHQQSSNSDNDLISKLTKDYLPLVFEFNFSTFEKSSSCFIKEDIHSPLSLPASIWHPPTIC